MGWFHISGIWCLRRGEGVRGLRGRRLGLGSVWFEEAHKSRLGAVVWILAESEKFSRVVVEACPEFAGKIRELIASSRDQC